MLILPELLSRNTLHRCTAILFSLLTLYRGGPEPQPGEMGQSKSASVYAMLAWWALGKVQGTAHRAGKTVFSLQTLPKGLHAITF